MIWNLQLALEHIRLMQPQLRAMGWHVCLGGGVLNVGFSDNDLDLYFIPLESDDDEPSGNIGELEEYLLTRWGAASVNSDYDSKESSYRKKLIFGLTLGKKIPRRVDVFII